MPLKAYFDAYANARAWGKSPVWAVRYARDRVRMDQAEAPVRRSLRHGGVGERFPG